MTRLCSTGQRIDDGKYEGRHRQDMRIHGESDDAALSLKMMHRITQLQRAVQAATSDFLHM